MRVNAPSSGGEIIKGWPCRAASQHRPPPSTMSLSLSSGPADLGALDASLLVVALPVGASLDAALSALDGILGGALARSLEHRDFRAEIGRAHV